MKRTLLLTVAACTMLASVGAMAESGGEGWDKDQREKVKAMSPEERKAFFDKRKAEWDAMSKEEKIKVIEERRQKRKAKMEEKWNSMSDDEKIKFVEDKMKRMKGHKKKGCGGPDGDGPPRGKPEHDAEE